VIRRPKILLATPVTEPGIDQLGLPVSFNIIPCNWKDRENITCALDPLASCPKALKSLLIMPGLVIELHGCLHGKAVKDNNPRAVPG